MSPFTMGAGMSGYVHHGKQVLTAAGFHIATCLTEEMARRIAEGLNAADCPPLSYNPENSSEDVEAAITEVNGRFPRWNPTPAMLGYARAVAKAACANDCRDALLESQYRAGVTAGWNAANSDDPEARLASLLRYDGHLAPLKRRAATPSAGARGATRSVPGVGGGL